MRTTIAIDEDVADRLKAYMRESGLPMKRALNAILRMGFEVRERRSQQRPYVAPTFRLGKMAAGLSENVGELLEAIEGADYK
ncbi:MAG TPA: hypothetical protein VIG46_11990 [Candidatus Baltobacteraceae bacterium]